MADSITHRPHRHVSDLRGAARLATEATLGLADLVEALHERIATLPGATLDGRVGGILGISGFVYKTVRGVTRLVGGSVDGLLGLLAPMLQPAARASEAPPQREREAVLAALNGVLGDHLARTHNPLATVMSFRHEGRALSLQREALQAALPGAGERLLVLLHGLCMNDLQWTRDGHDHGAMLAREAGYTPVYLHYNSGRPVHANGAELALLMEQLLAAWPQALTRVVLLGHSMGGLLARSALSQALTAGMRWPTQVTDLVCLGTPHHGAPLERAGHGVDLLLGAAPYAAPLARLGRLRSAGITDLRHGSVLRPPVAGSVNQPMTLPLHVPLPEGVRCHALAAQLGAESTSIRGRVLGDGLVSVASALGRDPQAQRTLAFEAGRQCVLSGMGHMELLSRPEAARQLLRWLA
jgi:pimeloyl-ACP methyl ester carboxylesterase